MPKFGFAEMNAFVAVAEQSSFAKAARQLGVSRSALSETIRALEEKLGVRLLNRTTRSVAPTEVGERLLAELRPVLESFEAVVESINVFRDKPAGHLRLTVPRPAAKEVIEPILAKFLTAHPAITLEVVTDSALADIVRDRFDAGNPGASGVSASFFRKQEPWHAHTCHLHGTVRLEMLTTRPRPLVRCEIRTGQPFALPGACRRCFRGRES
jgi:DNA-binding transcriptional LysR family regulator